eukprot:PhM_4_TR490/c0_g1_i1/m.65230
MSDDGQPHFSRVDEDEVESTNPITGRSYYFGQRPWRCDDRAVDLFSAVVKVEGFAKIRRAYHSLNKCRKSPIGGEPTDNYVSLTKKEVLFYVDRAKSGMLRDNYLERYPYDPYQVSRQQQEDGIRMRVWRRQREMELREIDSIEKENGLDMEEDVKGGGK